MSAQMAHDIKNPLGSIKGAAQLLQEEVKRGNAIKPMYLEIIVEQSNRLASVIDAYQRLGKVEPRPANADASALVVQTVNAARAGNPDVKIDSITNGAIECTLDSELVLPVLENLIRNAIEATSGKGHIRVEAKKAEEDLIISVTDDGPGMDVRTRARAGEEFFTTKATGSGLGLSFAKRVAEAHGGRMTIESEPGKGTRVALELPVKAV
jgi:signal transduction histidine kinase